MTEKVSPARLEISIYVSCPGCGVLIDLLDASDTDGINLNEDSFLIAQACPQWSVREHADFEINEVVCTECKTEFNVRELEW